MLISGWSSVVCASDLFSLHSKCQRTPIPEDRHGNAVPRITSLFPLHPGDTLGFPRSRIPAPNPMNDRHAFHAGNHADVLKHVALLALCDALVAKPSACFALDTHAGRGLYRLESSSARRTGEADDGIGRLLAERPREPAIARYLSAVEACRKAHGHDAYPGSPWLLAHALRDHDRIACCELQPVEAAALRANFAGDRKSTRLNSSH